MSEDISEKEWRKNLNNVLKNLDMSQYTETLEHLDRIPKSVKDKKSREEMPKTIIEYYGLEGSILEIERIMDLIPRRDSDVQDLLCPFVDKLKKKQEAKKKTGSKRKHGSESEKRREPEPGFKYKKNRIISDSDSSDEDDEPEADRPQSYKQKETNIPSWRKSIRDLKESGHLEQKAVAGKVVKKSDLRRYETKQTEKFFFYLGLADETGSIKVMVYGSERYQTIMENHFYMFTNVLLKDGDVIKVTRQSEVSEVPAIDVPEQQQVDAQVLICHQSPLLSISKVKSLMERTLVSVEGAIKEIGCVEQVKVKNKGLKKKKQDFQLAEDEDFIRISLWGNHIQQLRGISDGDVIKVLNVNINRYFDSVSLNSTDHTRIIKSEQAPARNVNMKIIGITTANKTETHLKAEIMGKVETFVVTSTLLAKAFGVKLQGNFKDRLIRIMPLSAAAEIRGSKINKITAAKAEM
ncbi:uncharacterized protein LOC115054398 [Echeneis naucrates]|uniref:uncharacterized protein LOC115054398 n=1 Tax=Echeneis naucrates TaxID=173247 RepID=UPI0011138E90|nr:uncharacterized protein LOC115054398 [Echeneis naucrates]